MTYLLDTNTLMWAATGPRRLSGTARRICQSTSLDRVVSVVSVWEIVTKVSLGKLPNTYASGALSLWPKELVVRVLSVEPAHVDTLYGLPLLHKDPFDRMLVAQAISEGFTIVTPDETLHRYPVKWVW